MMLTSYINIDTSGNSDIVDITSKIRAIIDKEKTEDAVIFLSVIGSTAGLTTMEYEPGQIQDLQQSFESLLPYRKNYSHNLTWSDDNGHSHLRSSLIKTQLFISVTKGKLDLGTWQQVVLIDFDTRPRKRKIVVKIII